jgi:hypothetical protein
MKYSVKALTVLFFLCVNYITVQAQQKHFIYIQSEDREPFAVVLQGKVFSSSDYGYVILPKLEDGDYNFRVSFPMNKFPDQSFTCSINKKDVGFLLKKNNDSWALQDIQSRNTYSNTATTAKTNAFGEMLSDVVSDSDLTKQNQPVTPQQDSVKEEIITAETPGTTNTGETTTVSNAEIPFTPVTLGRIQQIALTPAASGTTMVFIDKTKRGSDTINVFIPAETENETATQTVSNPPPASAENATDTTVTAEDTTTQQNEVAVTTEAPTQQNSAGDSNPFYNPEKKNSEPAVTPATATNNTVAVNTPANCDNMLSEDGLNKLKRKMFVQDNSSDMISYAVRFMKNKCLTTEQVKTLGSLFASDDGRYSLYDAMYNYVPDHENFASLGQFIIDPYYKKRFDALLR